MNKTKLLFQIIGIFCLVLSAALIVFFYYRDYLTIPKYTGDEYTKNVVVINIGGVTKPDFEKLAALPNIGALIANGAYSSDVSSVAPVKSLPVAAALLTGTYSGGNGIANDAPFNSADPRAPKTAFSSSAEIKAPTIFDKAAEMRFKTASINMPLTAHAKITYNLPKIDIKKDGSKLGKLLDAGSPPYILDLTMRLNKYNRGVKQPQLDIYSAKVAADTIANKKPNLLFVNFSEIEDTRKLYGIYSAEADAAFKSCDDNVKEIIDALKEAGIYETSTVVITAANSLRGVGTEVYINNIIKNGGLIGITDERLIWRAFAESAGELAFVRTAFARVNEPAMNVIKGAANNPSYGIARIIARDELDKYKIDESVAFAIQAKDGYCFKEELSETDVVVLPADEQYISDGCAPMAEQNKGILIMCGSGIKKGPIAGAKLVDIAPTVCKLLGLDFYGCDGAVINSAIG